MRMKSHRLSLPIFARNTLAAPCLGNTLASGIGFLPTTGDEPIHQQRLVGLTGLEPVTLRLSSACSNQLSYRPKENLATKSFSDLRMIVNSRSIEHPGDRQLKAVPANESTTTVSYRP